ncbi:hypothetical protein [Litchfieldella qijiaojingensis]|uniref:hypothetical protein n=1 Tax=Litchfieldella qijiaojingensis TaxID=980347 RepID=UPI001673DE57|nr:hypothetical protein [Halomonas qijiaojingensis]
MNITDQVVSRVFFIPLCLFFRVLLDFSYIYFVMPVFSHMGYEMNVDLFSYTMSWLLYFGFLVLTPHHLKRISDYFLVMAALAILAPLTSYYGLTASYAFPVLATELSLLAIYLLTRPGVVKVPALPILREGPILGAGVSICMVAFLVVWYWMSGAVRYFNLNVTEVYNYREASAELANVGLLSYVNSWVYQVFSLFSLAWALYKRYFGLFLIFFGVQVFFYGVAAHKSLLFYPFIIFGIWFYFRKTTSLIVVPLIFVSAVTLSLLSYFVLDNILVGSMFIRRVFFVPAVLTYDYFNFFDSHQFVWWSNSFLANFLEYPYENNVSKVIGEYNGSGSHANNGYVSSGYAHAGVLGILSYSVILGLVIRFIDVASANKVPNWFALAITVVPLRSVLISSDLFTVMLTHGLLIAILLLLSFRCSPRRNKSVAMPRSHNSL